MTKNKNPACNCTNCKCESCECGTKSAQNHQGGNSCGCKRSVAGSAQAGK